MEKNAILSPDRRYRYVLSRVWDKSIQGCVFIGLNPSTADENIDDPTIRRCIGFARDWGFGSLFMLNLFAFRATRPEKMFMAPDPVGPENNEWLHAFSVQSTEFLIGLGPKPKIGRIVAAWGAQGVNMDRSKQVSRMFLDLKCLGKTQSGQPQHPLYRRKDTKLEDYK